MRPLHFFVPTLFAPPFSCRPLCATLFAPPFCAALFRAALFLSRRPCPRRRADAPGTREPGRVRPSGSALGGTAGRRAKGAGGAQARPPRLNPVVAFEDLIEGSRERRVTRPAGKPRLCLARPEPSPVATALALTAVFGEVHIAPGIGLRRSWPLFGARGAGPTLDGLSCGPGGGR